MGSTPGADTTLDGPPADDGPTVNGSGGPWTEWSEPFPTPSYIHNRFYDGEFCEQDTPVFGSDTSSRDQTLCRHITIISSLESQKTTPSDRRVPCRSGWTYARTDHGTVSGATPVHADQVLPRSLSSMCSKKICVEWFQRFRPHEQSASPASEIACYMLRSLCHAGNGIVQEIQKRCITLITVVQCPTSPPLEGRTAIMQAHPSV